MNIKKIEVHSMYGRRVTSNTQFSKAKITVEWLLRTPIEEKDFSSAIKILRNILDEAQNQPPLGTADGSINKDMWNKLSCFLKACENIQTNKLCNDFFHNEKI